MDSGLIMKELICWSPFGFVYVQSTSVVTVTETTHGRKRLRERVTSGTQFMPTVADVHAHALEQRSAAARACSELSELLGREEGPGDSTADTAPKVMAW